jgi:glycosyltransferase involved in cell wall biosynthesis
VLVEALAGLRHLDWRLTCVGSLERDRAAVAAIRQAIETHDLGGRVTLAGECARERVDAAYCDAEIFVLPSYGEGYGMVYAEALAYGLPIVATNAGAVPETVPASAGLLVPPGDEIALRDALRRVICDVNLRDRLAAGASLAARALRDWPAAVRAWGAALDRLAT